MKRSKREMRRRRRVAAAHAGRSIWKGLRPEEITVAQRFLEKICHMPGGLDWVPFLRWCQRQGGEAQILADTTFMLEVSL